MEIKKEQLEAINHRHGNALVSASAGSGKTFVMIQRIISLILTKQATIDNVLCVTFTDKAAREMKEKLRRALSEKVAEGETWLAEQLIDVATADVSTLHAFCAKLIRIYFYVVNLSPDFSVLEEKTAQEFQVLAIERAFKKFYDDGEKWFTTLVGRYREKRKDNKLKDKILRVHEFLASEESPEKFLKKNVELYTVDGFYKTISDYKEIIDEKLKLIINVIESSKSEFIKGGHEIGANFSKELLEVVYKVLEEKDVYAIKKYSNFKMDMFKNGVSKDLETAKKSLLVVKNQFASIIQRVNEFLDDKERDCELFCTLKNDTENFIGIVKAYKDEYDKIKREENVLDFNDLERFALEILSNQDVLEEVKNKYKYIFIDEYQDTNDVQESIINKISNDNLFMVGDVKQSIYGFRGCKPDIFIDKLQKMKENAEKTITLNHNFRSAKNVIDSVNNIFSYSMTKDYYGSDYAVDSMLVPGGRYPEEKQGRAEIHFLQSSKKKTQETEKPRIYDVKEEFLKVKEEKENSTSLLIGEIIKKELAKTYFDVDSNEERSIKYGDIVLLTRNKDNAYVSSLITGLDRQGIPTCSEVKQNVCEFGEVKLLCHLLSLVDCFRQDIPLVSVMKSPIGNFIEEELASIIFFAEEKLGRIKNFYEAFTYCLENRRDELGEKIVKFYEYVKLLRFIADFKGAYGMLSKAVSDCGYENVLTASRLGEQKVKSVRKFIEESQSANGSLTVKEFLRKIKLTPKAFELSISAKEDAVRVMTIHASKGLEFPVVIICGLEKPEKKDNAKEDVVTDREFGISLLNYDEEKKIKKLNVIRGIIAEKTIEKTMREELRLFYVATTRAKYSLHLTFATKKDERGNQFLGANRYVDYIPKAMFVSNWKEDELEFNAKTEQPRKVLIGKYLEKTLKNMQKNLEFDYAFNSEITMPLKTSVTKANKKEAPVYSLFVDEGIDVTDNERGNVAHKILEHFDFSLEQEPKLQIEKMIDSKLLLKEEIEKINLDKVFASLELEIFKQIKDMKTYREKVFLVNVPARIVLDTTAEEEVLLQGVIDLLCVSEDKAIIVDYKYSKADANTLKSRYSGQLNLYAYAVEKVLKLKVERKVIVNVLLGEQVEVL